MTTPFDQARAERAIASTQSSKTEPNANGVSDLAFMALSQLANSNSLAGASSERAYDLPEPHIAAMARIMADFNSDEAEGLVADLLDAGVTVQELCLSHFTPAARELGRLWESDQLPFTEVAMAAARMQAMLRNLPGRTMPSLSDPHKGALFAAAPGETHTLGVLMAADHFRRLDWDVGVLVGLDHEALVREVLADDRPVFGLSCAGGHTFIALTRVIDEVRARRLELAIVVSGAVTQEVEALAMLPDCDGIVEDLESAEGELKEALRCARDRVQAGQSEAARG